MLILIFGVINKSILFVISLLNTNGVEMAYIITEECINCGACEPECPTNSISVGPDIYIIDEATCVECKDHYDAPQCVAVCPVDCCVPA